MKIGIASGVAGDVEVLRRVLALVPEHQVAWVTGTASGAVDLCQRQNPDLVLMDLTLPGDAIETTRRLVAQRACTVMIVTHDVDRNAARVFEAMRHGALDAATLPCLGAGDVRMAGAPFLAKIAMIGKLAGSPSPSAAAGRRPGGAERSRPLLVAIGASAGGPAALATLLEELPADLPACVVIVQHVDARFAPGLADWLAGQSRLPVRLAREGDRLSPGAVLVAGAGEHLVLKSADRLGYAAEPVALAYRPSIDTFFASVGALWQGEAVGVLLTGMGSDGAKGLRGLRALGHHTIAQDQASSAVYGMPKAAAAIQAAVEVLPLKRIASRLSAIAGGSRTSVREP